MKYKLTIPILMLLFSVLFISAIFTGQGENYEKYESYKYGFLPYYSSIGHKYSSKDKEKAQGVIDLAGSIMTDLSGNVPEDAGKLEKYAYNVVDNDEEDEDKKDDEKNKTSQNSENIDSTVAKIDVQFNLLSADFSFGSGYIWVEYTRTFLDENDSTIATYHRLAYWQVKNRSDVWTVVKIKESQI